MKDALGNAVTVAWSDDEENWLEAIFIMGSKKIHTDEFQAVTGRSHHSVRARLYAKRLAVRDALRRSQRKQESKRIAHDTSEVLAIRS